MHVSLLYTVVWLDHIYIPFLTFISIYYITSILNTSYPSLVNAVILSLYYQSTYYWMHCQHIRYQSVLHIANIHPPQSLPKWPKPLWYSIVLRIQLLLDPNSIVSIYFHLPPVLQNRVFEIRLFHCCKGCLL